MFIQGNISDSDGSNAEIALAKELGIPIFYSYEHARAWRLGEDEKERRVGR